MPSVVIAKEDESSQADTNGEVRKLSESAQVAKISEPQTLQKMRESVQIFIRNKLYQETDSRNDIKFDWHIMLFDGEQMEIKMDFEDPTQLNEGFDNTYELIVVFWDEDFFE